MPDEYRAMPHRIFSLLLLLTVAVWVPLLALAEADGPDFYAVKDVAADDVLNLRAGPSASTEKIGEIPHDGRGLRNLGCQGAPTFAEWEKMAPQERVESSKHRWCKVRYKDTEGWVAGRFLREASAPTAHEAR